MTCKIGKFKTDKKKGKANIRSINRADVKWEYYIEHETSCHQRNQPSSIAFLKAFVNIFFEQHSCQSLFCLPKESSQSISRFSVFSAKDLIFCKCIKYGNWFLDLSHQSNGILSGLKWNSCLFFLFSFLNYVLERRGGSWIFQSFDSFKSAFDWQYSEYME